MSGRSHSSLTKRGAATKRQQQRYARKKQKSSSVAEDFRAVRSLNSSLIHTSFIRRNESPEPRRQLAWLQFTPLCTSHDGDIRRVADTELISVRVNNIHFYAQSTQLSPARETAAVKARNYDSANDIASSKCRASFLPIRQTHFARFYLTRLLDNYDPADVPRSIGCDGGASVTSVADRLSRSRQDGNTERSIKETTKKQLATAITCRRCSLCLFFSPPSLKQIFAHDARTLCEIAHRAFVRIYDTICYI